jgi:CheY-like chemotaxis protein
MDNSTPRIALVDNDKSVCRVLLRLLRSDGFNTAIVSTCLAFIDSLEQAVPDCVLPDWHTPEMP